MTQAIITVGNIFSEAFQGLFELVDDMKIKAEELKNLISDKFSDDKLFELFCHSIIVKEGTDEVIL